MSDVFFSNQTDEGVASSWIISGFPAVGKTHFFENSKIGSVSDSDSSSFSWVEKGVRNPNWPQNYMDHIQALDDEFDLIMVSSHGEVRDALVERKLNFYLVYPERTLKEEYLKRCRERGSPDAFLEMLDREWDTFLSDLQNQEDCIHVVLGKDEYLADFFRIENA